MTQQLQSALGMAELRDRLQKVCGLVRPLLRQPFTKRSRAKWSTEQLQTLLNPHPPSEKGSLHSGSLARGREYLALPHIDR